jgi:hypothetical protein
MSVLGKDPAFVTQYLRNFRGGSQAILARASDGFQYVVKFANNLQGPNLLFNESAGSELYRACGLPVPEWTPLWICDRFLDRNPTCWIQTPEGRLRPSSGLCFGSRYLGLNGKRLLEILPGSMFKRVRNQSSFWLAWLIDVCAEHVDNRQAIFVEDADGLLDACFVDHGHLFGGPRSDLKRSFCASCYRDFRASCYLDRRIYGQVPTDVLLDFQHVLQALDADKLRQRVAEIPAQWGDALARESFERCILRLKTASHVQHLIDEITYDLERRTESESRAIRIERQPITAVLRFGLQGARLGPRYTHDRHCA